MNDQLRNEFNQQADYVLKPGELYFTSEPQIIKTLLGSCITATFYHHSTQLTGISHSLLPSNKFQCYLCEHCAINCQRKKDENPYKYVGLAIERLYKVFRLKGIPHEEIEVKLFGGAKLIHHFKSNVGQENIDKAHEVLQSLNLKILKEDTGGSDGRLLNFNSKTGTVIIRKKTKKDKERGTLLK